MISLTEKPRTIGYEENEEFLPFCPSFDSGGIKPPDEGTGFGNNKPEKNEEWKTFLLLCIIVLIPVILFCILLFFF